MAHAKSWCKALTSKILGAVLACGIVLPAHAEEAANRLWERLQAVDSLSAQFTQLVTSPDGQTVQQSQGTLVVRKPNRMRWVATQPYRETVVIDGEHVWFHDVDLEQVTLRAFTPDLSQLPALVFSSSREQLAASFTVEQPDPAHFRLLPRDTEHYVRSLTLEWPGQLPAGLVIEDNLGNRTTISFTEVRLNTVTDDSMFHFIVPPGTDVIDETRGTTPQ